MTTTNSLIDAAAVARALLDLEPEVGYDGTGRHEVRLSLPDGRTAALDVRFDEDAGIGRGDLKGDDDVFGTFAWRGVRHGYACHAERPDGFDGRARVFRRYGQGGDRIDGAVWWQPPADVTEPGMVDALAEMIDAYLDGEWFHVGMIVTIEDPGGNGEAEGEAALWGIEWGERSDHQVEVLADLLNECRIDVPSTANVGRWARDSIEAVARHLSGEDPGGSGPVPRAYALALSAVLAWWRDEVEASTEDWDRYAAPMTASIESDFNAYAFDRLAALGCELVPDNNGTRYVFDTDGRRHGPYESWGAALADPALSPIPEVHDR